MTSIQSNDVIVSESTDDDHELSNEYSVFHEKHRNWRIFRLIDRDLMAFSSFASPMIYVCHRRRGCIARYSNCKTLISSLSYQSRSVGSLNSFNFQIIIIIIYTIRLKSKWITIIEWKFRKKSKTSFLFNHLIIHFK